MNLIESCRTMFTSKPHLPDADWVAYQNGTVVFFEKSQIIDREDLLKKAKDTIDIQVIIATASADFAASRLDTYFPDEPIWAVTYGYPENMATLLLDDSNNALTIGLAGRARRQDDCGAQVVKGTSRDP
jgi:hypothetical protein